ncbi:hypothetical protein P43SY_001473 [Pythium insidiosum]|uniref:Uncharacterized protein n=1 Tax=Pythium insidiosum TaxID=114742 RepID=A0AAD5LN22_PYTIN|nr:hypothetical protein P43SY_001473 [Pythium insidiosum]
MLGVARAHLAAWLKYMLEHTLRDPVSYTVLEDSIEYADHLVGRLKTRLQEGLINPAYQERLYELVLASVVTDYHTGKRWRGPIPGAASYLKLLAQAGSREGTGVAIKPEFEDYGAAGPAGYAPITLEHIALRRWIQPKLHEIVLVDLTERYARALDSNVAVLKALFASTVCFSRRVAVGSAAFPDYRRMRTKSPVYFLAESHGHTSTVPSHGDAERSADKNFEHLDGGMEEDMVEEDEEMEEEQEE